MTAIVGLSQRHQSTQSVPPSPPFSLSQKPLTFPFHLVRQGSQVITKLNVFILFLFIEDSSTFLGKRGLLWVMVPEMAWIAS